MSLLDVNPQELFENHTVSDIEQVRIQIRHEIEKKKEELRVMVGERYRDLIDAADSISNMTALSQGIISDVNDIFFKSSSTRSSKIIPDSKPTTIPLYSFAAQVKLLVDLNQQIWKCLDNRNILLASVLYQYAFYVKTNVDIEVPHSKLVSVQWKSMGHFQSTILKHVEKILLELNPSEKETCECFLSLALLENVTTHNLLDHYIQLRSTSVKNCFVSTEDASVAKENVLNSYDILLSSISCIFKNFNNNGLLWTHGASVFNTPIWKLMHCDETVQRNARHLSEIVLNYKTSILSLEHISLDKISSSILNWLSVMKPKVKLIVEGSLKFVTSLKLIQDIHNSVQFPNDFHSVAKQLSLPDSLNIWTEMYQVHIIEKAKHLISLKWTQSFDSMHAEVLRAIKSCNSEKNKEPELDLRWYTWKESNSDLEFHERKLLPAEGSTASGLLLKSHGFTPRVVSLCNSMQSKISALNKDLNAVETLNVEKVLSKYQTSCCERSVVKLVEFLLDQISSESVSQSSCVLIARLSSCLTQFSPALQHTLDISNDGTSSWNQVTALLLSCNHKAWDRYIELTKTQYCAMFSTLDTTHPGLSYVLQSLAKWETVVLEEDNSIQVPAQPSLVLQESLLRFTSTLSRLSPSPYLRDSLTHHVTEFLLTKYSAVDVSGQQSSELVQRLNVQSLFDVRYLSSVLVRSCPAELQQKIDAKLTSLESSIDPFDLELLRTSLQENVVKCVARTQCLLGLGNVTATQSSSSRAVTSSPALIPLAKNTPWFPLLLVSNTSEVAPLGNVSKKTTVAAQDPVTLLSASAKSTFFSVTEWFGSN